MFSKKLALIYLLFSFFFFQLIRAADVGDALQLLSYRVTNATRPDVSDGQIAASTDPTDWVSSYVRVMTFAVDGDTTNDTRTATFLIANDSDSLYIGAAIELPNASDLNRLTLYFDQSPRGTLEGSSGSPGEYYVTIVADGSAPEPDDGHWDGSAWTANTTTVAHGFGIRKGAGGLRLYNFELSMPLQKTGDANNSYLNLTAGDEVNILPKITDNIGNEYFWYQTNAHETDPSATGSNGKTGWGEIQTIGAGISDRKTVALAAKDIVPTIDGNVSGDDDWRYAFSKSIKFSDFDNNQIDASFKIKEQSGPDNLLFGFILENVSPAASDYLAVYFDQGASGGDRNYILTEGGDPVYDHAMRVTGSGTFQDYYFDTSTWTADAGDNGNGDAGSVGVDWEVEFSTPLSSGDAQDLSISSGDIVNMIFKYYDSSNDREYWWSATINEEAIQIDPVDPVYNALGWGVLQTGGPFIQPIYPEDGDTLSGEYPLAIYALDPSDANPKTGIDYIGYEVRKEDQATGTVTTLLSGDMAKIEDDSLAIWTGTLNTRAIDESPTTPLRLVYMVYDGELDTVAVPIDIFINNEGGVSGVDDPTIQITSPAPNAVLSGAGNNVSFSVSTPSPLILDTVRVYIDGNLMQEYTPSSTSSYSTTYSWDTSPFPDGEHIIQVWAVNSIGIENFSPTVLVTTENTPSVTIDSPTPSSEVQGTETVNFTANPVAPSTLSSTQISIDGGTWTAVTSASPDTGGTGSHSWDTSSLPDGTHTIQVRTTDNNGKTGVSNIVSVVTDNQPPAGTLVADPDKVKNGDTIEFAYYALETGLTAVIPLAELQLLDDQAGSDLSLTDADSDGIYEATYTIDAANGVADGDKTLTATVTDNVNNTFNPQVTVTLDNTAPVFVSLASLDPDVVYVNGETILLLATFDASGYDVICDFGAIDSRYVSGSETVQDNGDGTYTIRYTISETNSRSNGSHLVTAYATDEVGLTGSGNISLTLSNSGPVVSGLTLADADSILNTDDMITATVTDNDVNIQAAEYFIDVIGAAGEGTALSATDGSFDSLTEDITAALSIADLSEGQHTLYVRGQNQAGKWGVVSFLNFMVDRVAPFIANLKVTYPEDQPAVRNGQVITISALIYEATTLVDPASILLRAPLVDSNSSTGYVMKDDGTSGDEVSGDGIYTAQLTVTSTGTGMYDFTIDAADIVPNNSQVTADVYLDNTAPVFEDLISLDPDTIYSNGETILLQADFDAPGYEVTCDFGTIDNKYVSGSETVQDNEDGTYTISYTIAETNSRSSGGYTITATAADPVGLTDSGTIRLLLDNSGPVISNLTLTDTDSILNADDVIYASVTDDDATIQAAEYFVDVIGEAGDGISMSPVDGTFDSLTEDVTAVLSISELSEGQHTLYVRGQNESGKWGSINSLSFIVDRMPPLIANLSVKYPAGQSAVSNGQVITISALLYEETTRLDSSTILLRSALVDSNSSTGYVMKDDGTSGDASAGDGIFTAQLTVTSSETDTLDFTVEAADIVPNNDQLTGSVVLDNTPPGFVSLISLDPDTIYSNGETILLRATFDAPGYKVSCDFSTMDVSYVSGSEAVQDNGDGTYRIRYTLSQTNTRPNGSYVLTTRAVDSVGLVGTGTTSLYLVNTGPVVTSLALDDADDILNTDNVITATVTDNDANIKAAEYFIDVIGVAGEGQALNPVDDDFDSPIEDVTAPLSIADLSEGQHTVYIHGQNVSGKWGKFVSLKFIVDRIAPTIENVHIVYPEDQTAAHNGQWIIISALVKEATTQLNSTSILLKSALVDANSASGYIMVDNGEKGDAVSNDGIFTARLKVTTTETDTFTFTIDASDIVPNNRQITGRVIIDNIKPSISLNVLPVPVNGEIYVPEVLVEGSYYDLPDSSEVWKIILEVKNAETDNINTSPVIIPPNSEREFARNIKLVEGQNIIHAEITDRAGNVGENFIIFTYINPAYTEYVDSKGGTVQSPDGTTVEIPAGALLSEKAITINTVNTDNLPDPLKGISLMKTAHQFGPKGLVFHKPVTITLTYNHLDLDYDQDMVDDFDESRLQVYYLDGNEWIRNTADSRDQINNTVTFTTNHFSIYALGNDDREAAFNFYWTQNPFNPDEGTTAVIELSEPGEITLNIYDLSGNLVRTLIKNEPVSSFTERRWDGLSDFNRFVGSGIYIYVFEFIDNDDNQTIIKKPIGIVK